MPATPLAKGSRSRISFKEETVFGETPPSAPFYEMLLTSETMGENIERVTSEDIRSDRTAPAMRGGNITAGGTITCDFAFRRHLYLWQHLLGCSDAAVVETAPVPVVLALGVVARGTYYSSGPGLYLCIIGGTLVDSATLTGTVVGGQETINNCIFEYVGPVIGITLTEYMLTGHPNLLAAGIAFEKQIIGGANFIAHLFRGGRIGGAELSINQRGITKINWNISYLDTLALVDASFSSEITPISEQFGRDEPTMGKEAFISLSTGGYTTQARPLLSASMSISNSLDESQFVISERIRRDLGEGTRLMGGKFSSYFTDEAEYLLFKHETETMVEFSFARAGEFFKIKLPECILTGDATPKIGGQGVITSDYDFSAYRQDAPNDIEVSLITHLPFTFLIA